MIGIRIWCIVKIAANNYRMMATADISANQICLPGPADKRPPHPFDNALRSVKIGLIFNTCDLF